MKAAAVYPDKKSLGVVADYPEPKIESPTGVKLRVLNVGVCGTDREIASFLYGTPPEGSEYLVIGHECIAEVVEVGAEVDDVKPGNLVIPMVRRPCDSKECIACRAGRPDFCYTGQYRERGIMKMHGFMTEFVVDEERYMNMVPATIRDVAVLVEPLTIAEKALLQVNQIQARLPWRHRAALVLGAGPVGLLGAMTLAVHGFEVTVYSKDREPNASADIIKAIGGKYISALDNTVEQMAAAIGDIDLVYEATGSSQLAFDVLPLLGPNGIFVLTGVPGHHGPRPFDKDAAMHNMVLKNQCLLGTVNAGKDSFQRAVADLGEFNVRWPKAVRGLITGRFPIDDFAQPIQNQNGIKNIIEIGQ